MVHAFEQALLALLLLVLMLGMGATLDPAAFRGVLRRPAGLVLGVASQFGWMPLIAYLLATALALPTPAALSLLLVGCTPGGTTSNLFAWFARANAALSVAMTVTSTVVAVVAMPLVLSLYANAWTAHDAEVVIPWGGLVTTLVLILVPLAAGMGLAARRPRAAAVVEKLGAWSGIAVLVLLIASSVLRNHHLFFEIGWRSYVAAGSLGVCGMALGWLGARLARLDAPSRRAVAFETGIQNSPLALGMIALTFPAELQESMLVLPLLYALLVLVFASVVTVGFRWADRAKFARDATSAPRPA